MITVQELIKRLECIEDKTLEVLVVNSCNMTYRKLSVGGVITISDKDAEHGYGSVCNMIGETIVPIHVME